MPNELIERWFSLLDPDRLARGLWWNKALSLVSGCTPVSEACKHCWSASEAHMRGAQSNPKMQARYGGLTDSKGKWTGEVRFMGGDLSKPLYRKTPTVYAVWTDLYHPGISDAQIDTFYGIAALCPQHVFVVLTKRPERAEMWNAGLPENAVSRCLGSLAMAFKSMQGINPSQWIWPLPNVVHGTTVELQKHEDRIGHLLKTPSAARFVSCEPLLSFVNLGAYLTKGETRDESQRGNLSIVNGDGVVHDRRPGKDMAAQAPSIGRQVSVSCEPSPTTKGRTEQVQKQGNKHGIFKDHVRLGGQAVEGSGPSHGLDDRQRSADTEGLANQSQERNRNRQQARELGDRDKPTECAPLIQSAGKKNKTPGGDDERECNSDRGTSSENPGVMREQGSIPETDRRMVRREASNNILHPSPEVLGAPSLDLVITGGESGPGARPMHPDWARSTRDQCAAAGIPFLFKQWGAWQPGLPEPGGKHIFVAPDGETYTRMGLDAHGIIDAICMIPVGKEAAGRRLDGLVHDGG